MKLSRKNFITKKNLKSRKVKNVKVKNVKVKKTKKILIKKNKNRKTIKLKGGDNKYLTDFLDLTKESLNETNTEFIQKCKDFFKDKSLYYKYNFKQLIKKIKSDTPESRSKLSIKKRQKMTPPLSNLLNNEKSDIIIKVLKGDKTVYKYIENRNNSVSEDDKLSDKELEELEIMNRNDSVNENDRL
jgi:hypothetical protein